MSKKLRSGNQRTLSISSNNDSDGDESERGNDSVSDIIKRFNKQLEQHKSLMKNLSDSYQLMSNAFDDFKKEIKLLKNENKSMKKDLSKLKECNDDIVSRMHAAEQYILKCKQDSNINHMVITNMPKLSRDTVIKNVVEGIANQIEYTFEQNEILDAYQIVNDGKKSFPIIVKLKTNNFKKECMKFRKNKKMIDLKRISPNLNNNNKNINFFHYLEKEYMVLLNKTKDAAIQKKYKFVWYADGVIMARKDVNERIIKIKNENELNLIQ